MEAHTSRRVTWFRATEPSIFSSESAGTRYLGCLVARNGELPEVVQHIRPLLHELHSLRPIGSAVIGATDFVLILVCKGRLDDIWINAAPVEVGARRGSEAVRAH